jgi:hypothetical protein
MKPIFGVANAEKATRSRKDAEPRCFSELFRLLKNASHSDLTHLICCCFDRTTQAQWPIIRWELLRIFVENDNSEFFYLKTMGVQKESLVSHAQNINAPKSTKMFLRYFLY